VETQASGVRGFTLIELLVVMVIAGILAAIAIPNYSEYIVRSNRSAAQSFIANVASRQAQFFLDRACGGGTESRCRPKSRHAMRCDRRAGRSAGPTVTARPERRPVTAAARAINQAGNEPPPIRCWWEIAMHLFHRRCTVPGGTDSGSSKW
jgi:prepilin-type N-terminal cleavage/methylation domain-containing protein